MDLRSAVSGQRAVAVAAVLAVAGAGIYFAASGTPTGAAVAHALELSTGNNFEVMSVEDRGSLDRVVLRQQGSDRVTEIWTTSNGQYIVSNPVDVANFTRRMEARNRFMSCVAEDATFYGLITRNQNLSRQTTMARLQLRALGGLNAAAPVFGGPGRGETVQVQGRQVPVDRLVLRSGVVWTIKGNVSTGILTRDQLADRTGCRLEAGGGPY